MPVLIVAACVSLVALVATARDVGIGRQPGERAEALMGTYGCGASPTQAFLSLDFKATGDVFPNETFVFHSLEVDSGPAETCDPRVAAQLAELRAAGCAVGPVRARDDESGSSRDLSFVCHAPRSEVVAIVARLSERLLTDTP